MNFHAEAIAIAGAFLGGVVVVLSKKESPISRFWLIWVLVCFVVVVIQQWWLPGIYIGDVAIAFIFLGSLIFSVMFGVHIAQASTQNCLFALGVFAAVSTLSALIGILQWLSLSDILGVFGVHTDFGDRAMGNLAQPNQLATLLLMGVCALTYLFQKRVLERFTFTLIVAILTFAIALTQSRTALLSASALAVYSFAPFSKTLSLQRRWIIVWLGGVWALFLVMPIINAGMLIGVGRDVPLTSSNSRDVVWTQVGHAIMQRPWTGYGWNRTATAHMASVEAFPGELTFTYAHNIFLDFLAWYGVPLGAALVGALIYWFWSRWRKLHTDTGVYAFAAIIPFAIHSLLEFPFAYGYFLVVAGLLVGMVEATTESRTVVCKKSVVLSVLLSLTVVGVVVVNEYLKVEEDFRVARFENMRIGRVPEGYFYSQIYVLAQMGEMLEASRMRPTPGMCQEDIKLLGRVAKRFPYGALTYRYVEALALNGEIELAKRELRILRGLYGPIFYRGVLGEIMQREINYPVLRLLVDQ